MGDLVGEEFPLRLLEEQRQFLAKPSIRERGIQRWGLWLDEKLIGIAEVVGRPPLVWIARIAIDAEYQRCGYGKKLLNAVIEALRRSARTREVRAAVHVKNTTARSFFEKAGFRPLADQDATGELVYTLFL
ncbi:MAG: GNAT family N-acetyltransferase [Bacteroidia bacterium]|nr:GNAT family N-acetyltransferase [Bacteroidia bacterium]MDW8014697.1 GNAT family N-acetyltransferase [Bacteroidia bacterium]